MVFLPRELDVVAICLSGLSQALLARIRLAQVFQMGMGLFRQFLKSDTLICFIWTVAYALLLPPHCLVSTLLFALGKESLEDGGGGGNRPGCDCDDWQVQRTVYFRVTKCPQPKAPCFISSIKTPEQVKEQLSVVRGGSKGLLLHSRFEIWQEWPPRTALQGRSC